MSFASGYKVAIQAAQSKRAGDAEARRARQAELENRIRGYVKDENGNYVPDARGQLAEESQQNELEKKVIFQDQQLELMKQEVQQQQSVINTRDMTESLLSAIQGRPQDAQKIINRNPKLRGTLQRLGVNQVAPVDWRNDKELYEHIGNLHLTPQDLQDEKKLNALNSIFMKVQKPNGEWYITSTEQLLHESNTKRYMTSKEVSALEDRVMKLGAVLKGTVLTDEEIEAKRTKAGEVGATSDYKTVVANESKDALVSWLEANPDKTINDYKAQQAQQQAEAKQAGKEEGKTVEDTNIDFNEVKNTTKFEEKDYEYLYGNDLKPDGTPKKKFAYSNEARNLAKDMEFALNNGKLALSEKDQRDMIEGVDIIQNFTKAQKLFAKVESKSALSKFAAKAKSYLNDDKSKNDDNDTKINRIYSMADTSLKAAIAKYVKLMSGAAVTDAEKQFFIDIISGGEYASGSELYARLLSFNDQVKGRLTTSVDVLDDRAPYSVLSIKEAMINAGFNRMQTPEQVIAKATTTQPAPKPRRRTHGTPRNTIPSTTTDRPPMEAL